MQRWMCKAKIHRARVTEADLNYVGSITIDKALMRAADIQPYEMVQVTGLQNAAIWTTYAIPGAEGSGCICLNGPPARLFQPGDLVIILSLGFFDEKEINNLRPKVVFVDQGNRVTRVETHAIK